jgi:exopolysaccharide production protein ExoY
MPGLEAFQTLAPEHETKRSGVSHAMLGAGAGYAGSVPSLAETLRPVAKRALDILGARLPRARPARAHGRRPRLLRA